VVNFKCLVVITIRGVLTKYKQSRGILAMNNMIKVGLGLAAGAAVVFAAGCAGHTPVFQCGKVDYKSMASCKGMTHCKGMTKVAPMHHRHHHKAAAVATTTTTTTQQ
jgi:hypothetical protein